ncbi:MAG: hypothetical protein V1742_05660 [Pseudomonadota bacterium]
MELGYLPKAKITSSSDQGISARKLQDLVIYQPRPFSSLEIEITTRCNLFCPSCPRAVFHRSWLLRDMSLETFEKAAVVFDQFETIHFRGWGEPLLNPFFPEMVLRAYQSGARLVLSTNGVEPINRGLLPYFEAIFFRLDYGRASTYERRNPEAKFARAIFNISSILHWRDKDRLARPQVVILFAKNKFSLTELPSYLETAVRLAPERVVFYQPSFHLRWVDDHGCLPSDLDQGLIQKVDERLAAMAESYRIDVVNTPAAEGNCLDGSCGFDRERAVFVDWSGSAAMCRHSALPVTGGAFRRYLGGKEYPVESFLFGSLLKNGLEDIMKTWTYRKYRQACLSQGLTRLDPDSRPREHKRKGNLIYLDGSVLKSDSCFRQ